MGIAKRELTKGDIEAAPREDVKLKPLRRPGLYIVSSRLRYLFICLLISLVYMCVLFLICK